MVELVTLTTIALSILSIIISLIVYGSIREKVKYSVVIDFVAFLTLVDIFLWNLMPAILRLFSGGQHEISIGVSPVEMLEVYTIEFISLLLFYIAFIAIFRVTKLNFVYFRLNSIRKIIYRNKSQVSNLYTPYFSSKLKPFKLFSIFIIALGVYFEIQKLALGGQVGITPALDWILVPVVTKSSFIFLLHFVFINKINSRQSMGSVLFVVTLFMLLGLGAANGSHGNIVAPVLYIIFYNIFHNMNRATIYVSLFLIAFLSLFYEEMHQVRAYASMANVENIGAFEKLNLILNSDSAVSETHTPGSSFLDKVEWRFGENSRKSVGYVRMYDKGESAGFLPLINSLHLLPRSFFPEKPTPGSVDGTELGMGIRLMHYELVGSLWNMSGFFTGLHSYWEHGLLGVIITSVLVGVYSAILLILFGNMIYVGLPLIIIMNDTWWWALPKLWSYEVSIQLFNILIPFLVIWYGFKFLYIMVKNGIRFILIKD
jgi:hypothetical protein